MDADTAPPDCPWMVTMALLVSQVAKLIQKICEDDNLSFTARSELLLKRFEECTGNQVIEHLDYAGVIPECFDHDSTEEKLFAKYCDYLLAKSWTLLGIQSDAILERTDAADVIGRQEGYRIVGDAKAFRLSRTAKNQKDFKVEALDKWRKGAEYACLVCPLYQYPSSKSQIYLQAGSYNVTLLSYTHLAYMLRNKPHRAASIRALWEVSKQIPKSQDASAYWNAVEKLMLEITATRAKDWKTAVEDTKAILARQAAEQIDFWQKERERIQNLTHKEATKALIRALKIDSKIEVISKNLVELEESTETFEP